LDLSIVPTKNETIQYQTIDQQAVLVLPVEGKVKVLNPLGTCIWENIDGIKSVNELIDSLIRDYAVERDQAAADIAGFINELLEKNMIHF
jgi:hypothetical protein